jgi:hypothetical protein
LHVGLAVVVVGVGVGVGVGVPAEHTAVVDDALTHVAFVLPFRSTVLVLILYRVLFVNPVHVASFVVLL